MSNLKSNEQMKEYLRNYMKNRTTITLPIKLRNRFNKLKIGKETMVDALTRAADAIEYNDLEIKILKAIIKHNNLKIKNFINLKYW